MITASQCRRLHEQLESRAKFFRKLVERMHETGFAEKDRQLLVSAVKAAESMEELLQAVQVRGSSRHNPRTPVG